MLLSFKINGNAYAYLRSIQVWKSSDSLLQGLQTTARGPNRVCNAISSGPGGHFVNN